MSNLKYRRVLLKLSGEALQADTKSISPKVLLGIADEIKGARALGAEVALVIGGGNIFRGGTAAALGMERATADYMGMLATVINALALQEALERTGLETRVQTAIKMEQVAEPYIRRRAMRHLEKGRIVIFAAGTGNPFFTTDTAASLRAMEIGAQVIIKATKVDGVYERDPEKDPTARPYAQVSYLDAINLGLKVMDSTAITLCMDNTLPIVVCAMNETGHLAKLVRGDRVGTLVGGVETALRP